MNKPLKFIIVGLHLIAIFAAALLILFVIFTSDLYESTLIWMAVAVGLAVTIAVELTAWQLQNQKRWAWVMALCLCVLYPLTILVPIGIVSLWGIVPTITFVCKSGIIDCRLVLVPVTTLCKSNVIADCRSILSSLAELCKSGVIDCRLELAETDEQPFKVNIGDHVSPDKPGPGAGRIETPDTIDRYVFTAAPGTVLVLKPEAPCTIDPSNYELHDVSDRAPSLTAGGNGLCQTGIERTTLEKGGTYILSVGAEKTGEYAFMLQQLSDDDQSFIIKLGDQVAPDRPGAGAGRIERPGSRDRYSFTAEPSTRVSIIGEPPCSDDFRFRMAKAEADDHSQTWYILNCRTYRKFFINRDHGGTYIITVEGDTGKVGDYGLALLAR